MTPFGEALRRLRKARGVTQRDMAFALGVSPAYLSALEHGHRSEPTWELVQRIIGYFNVIWDEAEELQRLAGLSRPKVVIDTSGLSPRATKLANRLAVAIASLDDRRLEAIIALIETAGEDAAGLPVSVRVPSRDLHRGRLADPRGEGDKTADDPAET